MADIKNDLLDTNEKPVKELNKKSNKIKKAIRFFLSVIGIIVVGYLILNYVPFIAKYDSYVIVTGSMDPVISERDVVIIDTSKTIDDMEVGQIIAFYADIDDDGENDDIVVHYLYSVSEDGVDVVIRTKPEISDSLDDWILNEEDIIGAHVATLRGVGSILMFATSTIGRVVLIFDVLIIYLLIEMFSDDGKKKKKSDDKKIAHHEENEAIEKTEE